MQSRLNPYLSFKDNAREAMEFYHSVFGGSLDMTTYEQGGMDQYPDDGDKIMHSMLVADNGITFMAADTPRNVKYIPGHSISMSLSGDNKEELAAHFDKLSAGGRIDEPLTKAPWGDTFGMLTDKFGVHWMVNIGSSDT